MLALSQWDGPSRVLFDSWYRMAQVFPWRTTGHVWADNGWRGLRGQWRESGSARLDIEYSPAEAVNWSEHWEGDDCLLSISGKVREASVHGPNLLLERTISTSLQSESLSVHDVVENQGVRESPLMVLYHFNFGFPLLTERSRIYAPSQAVEPATDFPQHAVRTHGMTLKRRNRV